MDFMKKHFIAFIVHTSQVMYKYLKNYSFKQYPNPTHLAMVNDSHTQTVHFSALKSYSQCGKVNKNGPRKQISHKINLTVKLSFRGNTFGGNWWS